MTEWIRPENTCPTHKMALKPMHLCLVASKGKKGQVIIAAMIMVAPHVYEGQPATFMHGAPSISLTAGLVYHHDQSSHHANQNRYMSNSHGITLWHENCCENHSLRIIFVLLLWILPSQNFQDCEGLITHKPLDPTLESIRHRFDIDFLIWPYLTFSMPNRSWGGEGEADSRVGSGRGACAQ